MNTWLDISGTALAWNFNLLRQAAGESTEVLAVIKANAYGHGAELCARVLAEAGANWLGVTSAEEGQRVRAAAGESLEIMVMNGLLPEDAPAIVAARLVPVIWTADQVGWLASNDGLRVHIEVDTGMGRQGVAPGAELDALLAQVQAAGLVVDGVLTHFCSSEVAGSPLTQEQQQLFTAAIEQVRVAGLKPLWVHAGNSSTLDNPAAPARWLEDLAGSLGARAMVRSGIALYGFCLPVEGDAEAQVRPALRPVMNWQARVLAVRDLPAGARIGYNATFTTEFPTRVALLGVGYADGLRRELSSTNSRPGGWAFVNGQRAPILGRISMNLCVVDVTAIGGLAAGDAVTVLGEGISAEQHAELAQTIVYEIVCGIHPCG